MAKGVQPGPGAQGAPPGSGGPTLGGVLAIGRGIGETKGRVLDVVAQSSKIFHENYRGPSLVPREFFLCPFGSAGIIVEIMCSNHEVVDMFLKPRICCNHEISRGYIWFHENYPANSRGSTRFLVERSRLSLGQHG